MSERTIVTLNALPYVTDGVRREVIDDFAPQYRTDSAQTRSGRMGLSSHTFQFDQGLGYEKMDFRNPHGVWDSANETRFPHQMTNGLLVNTATGPEVDASDTACIYSMAVLGGNLYGLAKYVDTGVGEYVRLYKWVGGSTQWDGNWNAGAYVTLTTAAGASDTVTNVGSLINIGALIACFAWYDASAAAYKFGWAQSSDGSTWVDYGYNSTRWPLTLAASDEVNHMAILSNFAYTSIWDNSPGYVRIVKGYPHVSLFQVTWLPSAGPTLGMTAWVDAEGNEVCWVRLREGYGYIDSADRFRIVVRTATQPATARGMAVWNGDLYVPDGDYLVRCWWQGRDLRVDKVGPADYDFASARWGHITAMYATDRWLFLAYGGVASHGLSSVQKASVLAWDGEKFHSMFQHTVTDKKIEDIIVTDKDDGVDRLHAALTTATDTSTMYYQNYVMLKPGTDASATYTDAKLTVTPMFGGDEPELPGIAYRLDIDAEFENDSTGTVDITYGLNGVSPATSLGSFTDSVRTLSFASGAGVAFKTIQFSLNLNRSATATNYIRVFSMTLYYEKVLPRRFAFTFDVNLEATAQMRSGWSTEGVISTLDTLADRVSDSSALAQMSFGQMADSYVKVLPIGSLEFSAEGVASLKPNPRKGYVTVRCEEPI